MPSSRSMVSFPTPEARDPNFLVVLPLEEFQFEDGSIWPEEPALSASIIKRDQAIKQHKARGKGIGMLFFPWPNRLTPIAARRALGIELLQLRVMLVTGAEPHGDGLQLQKVPRMMRIKNMPRAPGCIYARVSGTRVAEFGSRDSEYHAQATAPILGLKK